MKRISTDLQGFKRRGGSFAVQVVRLGSAEPPKRQTQGRLSQLPGPAPSSEPLAPKFTEKADGISAARPWQAAGTRIIEVLDQPQHLEKQPEPGPRRGRQSHEKLEHPPNTRKGPQAGPAADKRQPRAVPSHESSTAPKAVPVPRKARRSAEEILASLAETTPAPAVPAPIAAPPKAKRMRRSKIEALVAKLAEASTPSRVKRDARKAISEAGVRLTFRQRCALRHKST
ncbi:hypothetical protein SS37A_40310 (plasmid) [Methylocystis iwaonis]|uniref:Uncharacterized protein n=1 Tax=Methylocystis iwaonis TaxID=2885079 RepID=A0ABM8EEM9_9HYPH|nr:hypothetical protein SS37A_40310 [Methylocystis iwaonis]